MNCTECGTKCVKTGPGEYECPGCANLFTRSIKTSVAGRDYVRHVPREDGKTYCGRVAADVNCIATHEPAADAECRSCRRGVT